MSDHLDSPGVRADKRLDIADFYVFKGNSGGTVFVITTNPLSGAGGFWVDHHVETPPAHYTVKISRAGSSTADLALRATFGQPLLGGIQPMQLSMLTGADAADEDAEGQLLAEGMTGTEALITTRGVRFFAGSCGDPFFIEPKVITAVITAVTTGTTLDLSAYDPAHPVNLFGGTNVEAIVIEVPDELTGTGEITCWAEVKVPTDAGGWRQSDRAANPLVSSVFGFSDTDTYNSADPGGDLAVFGETVRSLTARVVAANATSTDPDAYGAYVRDLFLPDMLRYQVGSTADYGISTRNGRGLTQNTPETVFRLVLNTPVSDGLDASSATGKLRDRFPYLSRPA